MYHCEKVCTKRKAVEPILTYALEKGLNLDETIERLKELDCNKKALTEEINKYKIKDTVLTENQIRGFLSHLVNREYKDLNDGMYFINVFVNKILIYKNGRIVVILNIGDPDGGGELKKIVHQLSGQVHH